MAYRGQISAAPQPLTLWTATTTLTASGNSGLLDMTAVGAAWLSVYVPNAPTGTTPTLDVYYDQQDAAGNLLTGLVHIGPITAVGPYAASFGVGIGYIGGGAVGGGLCLSGVGRVQWVLGGTTPSFGGATISLIGR